jgi:serine/threonine-protein kinase RsbW
MKDMTEAHIPTSQVCTSGSAPFVEVWRSMPSQVAAISPFVEQLMLLIASSRSADESHVDSEIALREALTNAVVHGNHEDEDKRVEVLCRCGADGEVSITIRDEGNGFEVSAVPGLNLCGKSDVDSRARNLPDARVDG